MSIAQSTKIYNENEAVRWVASLRNGMSDAEIDTEIRRAAATQGIEVPAEEAALPVDPVA